LAVVHPLPGMTRDRHFADAVYRMRQFTVIDTGGYEDSTESRILQQMRTQSVIAMQEADAVIFLTDVLEPDDPTDHEIIGRLRSGGKPFFLAVNKAEGDRRVAQAMADFSRWGVDVYAISAKHGEGVYDLLDAVTASFSQWDPDEDQVEELGPIGVAIVGRQNVGKSTLLNKLFGSERVIANPIGGTTRDAIDVPITVGDQEYVMIDTAGIRRRGKIARGPEALSVHSSFRAIDRAQVALLVIDAAEGVTLQDQHVAGYILERMRSCVILLNKWDMIPDRQESYKTIIADIRHEFRFMPWAPIMTISALTGQRTSKIWELIRVCADNFRKEFKTADLNMILKKAVAHVGIPTRKGNAVSIKYVTQTGSSPPTLSFFVNDPKLVHFSYRRYLTNQFYQQLGLEGTPLVLRFRRKAPPRGWERNWGKPDDAIDEALARDEPFMAGAYTEEGVSLAQPHDLSVEETIDEQFIVDDKEDEEDDE
ncbi:MAG: ribosome biogenesis GTPase Der, partial [Candidatus Sumerlaeota bacterium]